MWRGLFVGIVTFACALSPFSRATAAVKVVSTIGEATVYLSRDFSKSFDLVYTASLKPVPKNAGFSLLGVMILGTANANAVTVGVFAGPKGDVKAYVETNRAIGPGEYKLLGPCSPTCEVELRGDATTLYAFINGRKAGSWARASIPMVEPYVQINGQAEAVGDTIDGRLVRRRAILGGRPIPAPTCAFTTQGVEPSLSGGTISFVGARRTDARVTYISLIDGRAADACP